MKLTRTKSYKLNMGKYESMELSATVSVSDVDILTDEELDSMAPDEVMAALKDKAEQYLDQNLDPALEEAAGLSAADDSMLFTTPPPKARPARREKTRNR